MAIAGRQAIAMVDFDHAAIAAGPSRRHDFAVRGRSHRIAHGGAEIKTGVHGRATEERIDADPEAGREFNFADYRLAIGHQRQRPVQTFHLRSVDIDPIELALEGAGVGRKFDGNEGTAHAGTWRRGLQLRHVEAEIADDAAHPAHARFDAVFDRIERRHLAALDAIERRLQADEHVVDSLDFRELVCGRLDGYRRTRFEPRLAVWRRHEDRGIADRRWLWCPGNGVIRRVGSPRRRSDRSCDLRVRHGAQRRRAGFQGGLATHDMVKLLIELFLIEQLSAGGAIDLGAQLGDSVFVGVLHLRLAGEQPGQNVITERKIGRGRRRPHAKHRYRADHNPEYDGPEPDLFAGVDQGIAFPRLCRLGRNMDSGRSARGLPAVVMRVVMCVAREILGLMTGTIRHRHSRADRTTAPYGSIGGGNLTCAWLIFRKWSRANHVACAAASTSSAWPSTLTLRQILTIRPSAPIKTVVRSMPRKIL